MTDKRPWHLYDAYDIGIESGNVTFWTAMIKEIIPPHSGAERVLDFGCGDGQFLRLLHNMRPFASGLGVDIDAAGLKTAEANVRVGEPIKYGSPKLLDGTSEEFDLAFSQEVFWMIDDLPTLAKTVFRVLKEKGEFYATMGCHIENPIWPHRRQLLKEQGFDVFDYSLDEVVSVFYDAGFEVGVKRLPVDYFNIVHPKYTQERAQSVSRLVETTYEHKMLFYFRRDTEWRQMLEAKNQ
jgi:SAM-dependent methyltransferase